MSTDLVLTDVPGRSRYEAHRDGELAGFVEYRAAGGELALTHAEVRDEFEGKGVGSDLARAVLDRARAAGTTVRPLCPFVAEWIRRHPDYLDVVADRYRDDLAAGNG